MPMSTTVLPFQPLAMSPAQLAAVSYLARYSGRTHTLYAFQVRRWFAWCDVHALDPSHSLRQASITNALDACVPLRDAQILARHADPRTTEHYDRARGNLDRHGVHFLTAYVAGV